MGLTNDTYFEDDKYMTVSQYKRYEKCEVLGQQGFTGDKKSEALLFGSYVDAYIEGTLDKFIADTPEMFVEKIEVTDETIKKFKENAPEYVTRNDTMVAKKLVEAKRIHKDYFDVTYTLKAVYKQADDICKFIDNDPVFSQFMSGDKQTIMSGEIAGVPFKVKLDSYSEGIAINDLKVMRSVTDSSGNYVDFITPWGYHIQAACYQEIVRQNTGQQLPFYICAVTKEDPIDSVIVQIPQHLLDTTLYQVECDLERIYKVKMGEEPAIGCGHCKACVSIRPETPIITLDEIL